MQSNYKGRTLTVTMLDKKTYEVSIPHVGGFTVIQGAWPQVMQQAEAYVDTLSRKPAMQTHRGLDFEVVHAGPNDFAPFKAIVYPPQDKGHAEPVTFYEGTEEQAESRAKAFIDGFVGEPDGPYMPANQEEACLLAVQAKIQEAQALFRQFNHADPYLQSQLTDLHISISEMLADLGSEAVNYTR